MRTLALLFSLALGAHAFAQAAVDGQTQPATTPLSVPLDVQRLAPQLVAFAGGDANFQNLVNGLASGTTVTLTTVAPTGAPQIATFTPTGTMTAQQIAQTLENVRQSLIARGIAAPNAPQLATALAGGALLTPSGPTQVGAAVSTTATAVVQQQQPSPAVQIQNTFGQAAAGASTALRSQTSDSRFPRGISDTPSATMAPQTPAPIATPRSTEAPRITR
jgi:hypothetical protein